MLLYFAIISITSQLICVHFSTSAILQRIIGTI